MDLIRRAERIVCVCGAGISTNAGIPDFKSAYDGDRALRRALTRQPDRRRSRLSREKLAAFLTSFYSHQKRPTAFHMWMARLERKGRLQRCYTMNIDGLERQAGLTRVVEVHGSADCGRCGRTRVERHAMEHLYTNPRARESFETHNECTLLPDIVLYGERVRDIDDIQRDISKADLVLCAGTRLAVNPIKQILRYAKQDGKSIVVLNHEYLPKLASYTQITMDCDEFSKRAGI